MPKRIMSVWKAALFFVFCLIISVLINAPVGLLLTQVKIPQGMKLSQLQGSLYQGRTDTLIVDQFVIQDLEYQFKISCLISANLCYQINFMDGTALIQYSPITGTINVSQLDVELSMSNLAGLSKQLIVKPTGSLNLGSDKLKFKHGKLVDIEAIAIWKNAGIAGDDISLGDYQFNIKRDAGQYQAKLVDMDATLDVEGQGELKPDGKYSLNININAKAGLEARIKSALEFVASKKGLRQYHIQRSGTLDKRLLSYLSFEDV